MPAAAEGQTAAHSVQVSWLHFIAGVSSWAEVYVVFYLHAVGDGLACSGVSSSLNDRQWCPRDICSRHGMASPFQSDVGEGESAFDNNRQKTALHAPSLPVVSLHAKAGQ